MGFSAKSLGSQSQKIPKNPENRRNYGKRKELFFKYLKNISGIFGILLDKKSQSRDITFEIIWEKKISNPRNLGIEIPKKLHLKATCAYNRRPSISISGKMEHDAVDPGPDDF